MIIYASGQLWKMWLPLGVIGVAFGALGWWYGRSGFVAFLIA